MFSVPVPTVLRDCTTTTYTADQVAGVNCGIFVNSSTEVTGSLVAMDNFSGEACILVTKTKLCIEYIEQLCLPLSRVQPCYYYKINPAFLNLK